MVHCVVLDLSYWKRDEYASEIQTNKTQTTHRREGLRSLGTDSKLCSLKGKSINRSVNAVASSA